MNLTNEQALNNIYAATRLAPLNADQHDAIRKMAEQVLAALAKVPVEAQTEPATTTVPGPAS